MATGGLPTQQTGEPEDQLVQPMEDTCPTHTSVPVTEVLFCRGCDCLLCAQCWENDHEGHDVVPLNMQQQFLNQSLQSCLSQLQDRKQDSAAVKTNLERDLGHVLAEEERLEEFCRDEHGHAMTRLEEEHRRKQAQEVERYDAQLALVQEDVGGQVQELQTAVTQAADDVSHVETLLTQLRLLTLTTPVARVASANHAAEAALQRPTPGNQPTALPSTQQPANLRTQLQAVVAEVEKDKKKLHLKDPVVVFNASLNSLLAYVNGKSDRPPGPLQGPTDSVKAYNYTRTTAISSATAGNATAALGQAALPRVIVRHDWVVTTLASLEPLHVVMYIHEQPGDRCTFWWLPVGVSVGWAVSLALGYTPAMVTADCRGTGQDISQENMLSWWDQADVYSLHVWRE